MKTFLGVCALGIAALVGYAAKLGHDRGESVKGAVLGAIVVAVIGVFILTDRGEPSPARRKIEGVLALVALAAGWISYLRQPPAGNGAYQSGALAGMVVISLVLGVFALRRLR